MFAKKTKLQLCARNLTGVEHDLVDVTFPTDLVGAVNDATPPVIGDTVITVDGFSGGNIPTGCVIGFAGDDTTYYVSTGGSATSITIDPPLKTNLADDQVVTIYPHFDITQYWTNDVTLEQQAEFTQAELVFDKPLRIELFNKNSVFYDRDTHSTGWGLTTAYFSTYNAQSSTDNQYIRISLKRNGTWYQKYNGKIKQSTLEIDEISHLVSFETESVFYGLKDYLVSQIDELYYLHKYTSSSRKTKTPSGKYVDVIRALFKKVGIGTKSYTITDRSKYFGDFRCGLTTNGTHNIQVGELITVTTGDKNFDGTHIVSTVTSDTVQYYRNDDIWAYVKDDVNATVLAGNTSFVLQAGLSPASNNYVGYCKIGSDTTIYSFTYVSSTKTVTVSPALAVDATINADVYLSYHSVVDFTTATIANAITAHRIYFDISSGVPTDYFNVTHQGHTYNLLDLFWITEKWMVQDVEAETGFDILKELCLQLGAVPCIDYIAGIAYGFFRSKTNTSSSKVTLTQSKIIGEPKLRGNWAFYSADGVVCNSQVGYWNGESQPDEFCYAEDLSGGDYQRYLSETPSTTVLAYEKYSTSVCADSFNNLAVGNTIRFRNHDTVYTVTAIASDVITITPPLTVSVKLGEKFRKVTDNGITLKYPNCFNIKLKYPNIFLADSTTRKIRKYWNNGTATLGLHPMSYYTSEVAYDGSAMSSLTGVTFLKNIPVTDGHLFKPNGDELAHITSDGVYSYVRSSVSRYGFPYTGMYELQDPQVVSGLNRLVHGFIQTRDSDNNAVSLFSVLMTSWSPTGGVDLQIGRISLNMDSYGDEATARRVVIKEKKRKKIGNSRFAGGFTDSSETVVIRKGSSSDTAFANEFDLFKLSQRFYTQVFFATLGSYPGLIGTGSTVYSMCLNADVLNPNYDDLIYADANHAECIRKAACFSPTSAANVFTGTSPGAGKVRNFIVNHGESTAQEYYYCLSTDGTIIKNNGTAWTNSSVLMPDITGTGGIINVYSLWGMSSTIGVNTSNVKIVRKAYDNFLVVADPTALILMVVDVDSNMVFYIEDTTVLDNIADIDIQCFTNWYDYQGATNSNIFENDVCFNASKLAYKFYSKNRRPYDVQARDVDLGYIDYALFDRMTIDSGVLSAASGSPKFYVYGYKLDCRTHDHKLTLLESVE